MAHGFLMRAYSAPLLPATCAHKPRVHHRASLTDHRARIDRAVDRRTRTTRDGPTSLASDSAITMEATDSIRHIMRDAVELQSPDFRDAILRATMTRPSPSCERVEVALASPVACPTAATESGARGRRVFAAEFTRLAAVEHPNLLKPLGVVDWSFREASRHGIPSVAIVWEGGFRDDLASFATRASPEAVLAVLCDVAQGLLELHRKDLAHGNVCCENVVVTANGRGKLADFQLASCLQPVRGLKVDRVAAPELILQRWESGRTTHRSCAGDVYSLAMAAVVALTGELPFGTMADDEIIERLQVTKAVSRPDDLDDEVWARLSSMLSANPFERPSMEQLHIAFHALSREAP